MPSRDIHSRDGGIAVRDLLASLLSGLLLDERTQRPVYLISPWLTDFRLLDNSLGQYRDLFRYQASVAEAPSVLFSDVLMEISHRLPVRVITWPGPKSETFAASLADSARIDVVFEDARRDHQKGLLTDLFYLEGSMNFTYSGVYFNKEKITCTAAYDSTGVCRINDTYLEFDRIWSNVKSATAEGA